MYSISNRHDIPHPARPRSSRLRRRFGATATTLGTICLALAMAALCARGQQPADHPYTPARAPAHPTMAPTPAPLPLPGNLHIPAYAPGRLPFRSGETLVYRASWLGVPAADARILIMHNKLKPQWWTGVMTLNTSEVVDVVYRMRDVFSENFDYTTLRPNDIYILQHEKKRLDQWRVNFDHAQRLVTAVKTSRHGKVTTRRFSGGDPLGPFSGAMMALSQPLRPGQSLTFDVFSGGNRYVFAFKVVARERITTALGTFDTLKIEPWVLWLSEESFRRETRATTVWVTDDARHLPVRIAAEVFFGSVYADLIEVTGAPPPASAAMPK
jgi:uncharacterized protein DUF3108